MLLQPTKTIAMGDVINVGPGYPIPFRYIALLFPVFKCIANYCDIFIAKFRKLSTAFRNRWIYETDTDGMGAVFFLRDYFKVLYSVVVLITIFVMYNETERYVFFISVHPNDSVGEAIILPATDREFESFIANSDIMSIDVVFSNPSPWTSALPLRSRSEYSTLVNIYAEQVLSNGIDNMFKFNNSHVLIITRETGDIQWEVQTGIS